MATSLGYRTEKHPIAQSFYVPEVEGIFVTKIQLYFQAADASFPVHLQLRPVINGVPAEADIIPGTVVTIPGSSVNTSADATSATTFTFPEPVFLSGETDYSIVVHADSKDYFIYMAEINEFRLNSTEKRVDKQANSGSLFASQNGVTWTPVQEKDLMFKIFRANFTPGVAEAYFYNASLPKRLLGLNPITATNGSATVTVSHRHHGLSVGDTITISGATATGGISASNINGDRSITARDWTGYQFTAGGTATSNQIGGGNAVLATKNIPYTILYPNVMCLEPSDTAIRAGVKSVIGPALASNKANLYTKLTEYAGIIENENNISEETYVVMSDSLEDDNLLSNQKSLDVEIQMLTNSNLVSPVIDTQRLSATLIDPIIDNQSSAADAINYVAETNATGGTSGSKHITRVIELESSANGLKILVAANRPSVASFDVYYRVAEGDEVITDKDFTLQAVEENRPSDENPTVFRDYEYLVGGIGGLGNRFDKFQVKIVLKSTNAAKHPVLKDLRIIALGT